VGTVSVFNHGFCRVRVSGFGCGWARFAFFDRINTLVVQKFTLEDAIGSHAFAPLEASRRATNGIPLG
jgi:hypothetical protein